MQTVSTQSQLSPGFSQSPVNQGKIPDFEFNRRRVSNPKHPALPQIANNTAPGEPYCPVRPWDCHANYRTVGFCPNYLRLPEVADPEAPWLQACYQENQSSPDPEHEIPDIPPLSFKNGGHTTDANQLDPLFCAYSRGGTRAIETLLQRAEVDPNACDGEGRTLMHYAVQQNDEATVQLLLANGACVDGVKGSGLPDTPLHTATRNSLFSMVELLVMANADLDNKGCDGLSPIEIAIKTRHSGIFRVLLENGATLDGQGLSPERKTQIELHTLYFNTMSQSILDDDWVSFQQLLLMVDDINRLSDYEEYGGSTLLAIACTIAIDGKRLDYVRDLINKGVDVNKADEWGGYPLHTAAINPFNSHSATELLIAHGADSNIANEEGITSLHFASLNNNLKVVERLLAHGANPNAADRYGKGPLVYACQEGDIATIRLLLNGGALLLSNQGEACLSYVHAHGVEFVQLLLDHAAGLDPAPGNFASELLLPACVQGEEQDITAIAQRLIDNKADVNIRDAVGWTPLLFASRDDNDKLVNLLLDRGADPDIAGKIDGRNALSIAAAHGHATVVGTLIKHIASPDRVDHKGRTALINASSFGHTSIVKQLIRAGASLNSVDQIGANALHYASAGDHTGVMEQLIANGVPLNQDDMNGSTPLHMACINGQPNAVRLLIDKGAALDSQDISGFTPIRYACRDTESRKQDSRAEVIELLIRAGADAFKPANDGSTPMDEAERNAEYDIVRILRDHANSLNKSFNRTLPRKSPSHAVKQGPGFRY